MKENIKDKYKAKVIKDKHLTNEYLLKTFYDKYSFKNLMKHFMQYGCFYFIHKKYYGDYLTKDIVLKHMGKLQKKISNKIVLDDGLYSWTYELEEDKQD
jgi:hypothetical protein